MSRLNSFGARIAGARIAGARIAIDEGSRSWSYSELWDRSGRIAAAMGPQVGSRVAILAAPGSDFVSSLWAIWRCGAIAVPLCTSHPWAEWKYVLDNSGTTILLASAELRGRILSDCPVRVLDPNELQAQGQAACVLGGETLSESSGALMLYTSGTTGRPKGALITHGQLESQIQTLIEAWRWKQEDRTLHVLPLHHTHGLINVLCCGLLAGARLEMMPKFDATEAWERLASGELTLFMAVPTIYNRLIQAWDGQDAETRARWSKGIKELRLMVSGSAALPVSVFETWERISGHRLLERYGMTEIGMAISNPLDGERRPGTVGQPLPRVRIRRVDDAGVELFEPLTPGEIWVSGPSVFEEYWQRPDATREAFVLDHEGHRWFKTGDVAVLDDGYFRLLGRTSVDILKSGGYKISALEIEERLREFPGVVDCAVVGKPDSEWGERVACAVVLSPGVTLEQLQAFSRDQLARYKVPSIWKTVSELPRNAMGKVLKPEVRKLFSDT